MRKKVSILAVMAAMLLCYSFSCNKEDKPGNKINLPVTIDFIQMTAGREREFTQNGVNFQSGGGNWRNGNCAVTTPAQPLAIYAGFIALTGAEVDYTTASSIVADVDGASIHKVTVKMYAKDAYDRVTMQPLPSAYITLCDGSNVIAEATQYASQTTESNGQIVQTWQLDASGVNAKRLIISSDDARIFSIVIE